MKKKITLLLAIAVLAAGILGGCTVSNGVFMGLSQQSGNASLSASYISFDGSLARTISLKAGDELSFRYVGDEGLRAIVKQDGQELFEITDSAVYTVPIDGRYAFIVDGKAENGAFSLSWQID